MPLQTRRARAFHLLLPLGLLLAVTAAAGCYQRFREIRAVETPDALVFQFPDVAAGQGQGQSYELLDLSVSKRDCQKDCTAWMLVREAASEGSANLTTGEVVYGVGPDGMERRTPAETLPPGDYIVDATVQQYDASGQFVDSLSMEGSFTLRSEVPGGQRTGGGPPGGGG